ncbi:DUF3892 domain-containing protein [Vagococcus sp. BWB3-3]|uniref:DUF3892 domain-containing protein n=1 Tax=Vagococcus allomyrinae TaxID=2794353 RepID=A0A940PIZ5_9ENTE|nr:DUF3892 domain-containing protein [Vagococcus allomyrinae]
MINYQVTHIRRRSTDRESTESIFEVRLNNGDHLTIDTLISYIDMGFTYYYRDQRNQKITIESFHPFYKQSFIRSNNHMGVSDCLLSLPSF